MRVIAGPEKKTRVMSEKERRVTAFHEMGHALVAHFLENTDPVHKISVISPRPGARLHDLAADRGQVPHHARGAERHDGDDARWPRRRGDRLRRGHHRRIQRPREGHRHGQADGHALRHVREARAARLRPRPRAALPRPRVQRPSRTTPTTSRARSTTRSAASSRRRTRSRATSSMRAPRSSSTTSPRSCCAARRSSASSSSTCSTASPSTRSSAPRRSCGPCRRSRPSRSRSASRPRGRAHCHARGSPQRCARTSRSRPSCRSPRGLLPLIFPFQADGLRHRELLERQHQGQQPSCAGVGQRLGPRAAAGSHGSAAGSRPELAPCIHKKRFVQDLELTADASKQGVCGCPGQELPTAKPSAWTGPPHAPPAPSAAKPVKTSPCKERCNLQDFWASWYRVCASM